MQSSAMRMMIPFGKLASISILVAMALVRHQCLLQQLRSKRLVQVGEFMGIEFDGPTACITDNKATYDIVRNPGATKRTAHFDRWLHFARELYLKNAIKIYLTTTDKMMADIMTKPTDKTTFLRCCAYILTDGHLD